MTPQIKVALVGLAAAGVSKFYFRKDWHSAAFFGFAAISALAFLTAHTDEK